MAAHRVDLGNKGNGRVGIRVGGGNRGPQAGSAPTHDDDVMPGHLNHGKPHGV